jgi:SAM-dependent methyltransferase
MLQELHFAAAMNWLTKISKDWCDPEEYLSLLHALQRGADNAEGLEIPAYVRRTFASLKEPAAIPNYIQDFLTDDRSRDDQRQHRADCFNAFCRRWHQTLPQTDPTRISVIEPACGSANDYRFIAASGLARLIDYTGFDLSEINVANARALFPDARFDVGNVFNIAAPDKAFDHCIVHDLLEHLSPAGLERAVSEICRVTRRGMCIGFFQMDEMPEHIVRPMGEYHVNTLSLSLTEQLFTQHGFQVQPVHIGTYLQWRINCNETHNPNAYTFLAFGLESRLQAVRQPDT